MFSMKVGWKGDAAQGKHHRHDQDGDERVESSDAAQQRAACCGRDGRMAVGGLIDHASPLGKLERELARTLRRCGSGGFS